MNRVAFGRIKGVMLRAAFWIAMVVIALVGIDTDVWASSQTQARFFCPWADMVLRIDYDRAQGHVAVTSGSTVPTPGTYEVKASRVMIGAANVEEVRFAIPDDSFWYTFVLQVWPNHAARLDNIRIQRESQRVWKQSGYCFMAH